jgi:hypothetical protein
LTLPQNRKPLFTAISAATLLIACLAITGAASAQTFNPQQPPDFGNFNGTRPDFGGNPGDFNGSGGFPFGGDFNGTFPGRGDSNFTRPDFSGAPNQYGANSSQSPEAVSGSQTDYKLIIAAVIAVVAAVAVATLLIVGKKKSGKTKAAPKQAKNSESENFDF